MNNSLNCQSRIVEQLVVNAAELYGLPAIDITGYSKKPAACIAREMVWMICRDKLLMKYRCIAIYFSGRDYKAVHSGVKTIRRECQVIKGGRELEMAAIIEGVDMNRT